MNLLRIILTQKLVQEKNTDKISMKRAENMSHSLNKYLFPLLMSFLSRPSRALL